MEYVEKSIEVEAPLDAVYNQWTQFEEFPQFMEGVKEVRQLTPKRLFWRAQIMGKEVEWEAEIYEQTPDERIAWRSVTGEPNSGTVLFQSMGDSRTQITLRMSYEPQTLIERAGDALGFVRGRVEGDLKRFKHFIEEREVPTGAWRGEIHT